MVSEFSYTLQQSIKIAKDGQETEAVDIWVKCPRPKDKLDVLKLENLVTKAITKIPEKADAGTISNEISEEDKVKGVEQMLIAYSDPSDLIEMVLLLSKLLAEGNVENPQATIDNVKFTKPIFDLIGHKDAKALLGRYAAHFLL